MIYPVLIDNNLFEKDIYKLDSNRLNKDILITT